jgi:hypothetical protein
MTSTQITTWLLIAQATITFLISVRAFIQYRKTRGDVFFILGMALGIIAVVGIIGIIGDNYFASQFSTKWLRYTAQIVSYTFIFLCSVRSSEEYMQSLRQWQWLFTFLLLAMLLATPWLTPLLPQLGNPLVEAPVSFMRGVICFVIFLNYAIIFMRKETRFSLLMGLAFLLISFGILITTPWYFDKLSVLYLYIGDGTRTGGLVLLLAAFLFG